MTRSQLFAAFVSLAAPVASALAEDPANGASEAVGAFPSVQQGVVTGLTALIVFGIVFLVLAAKVWPAITKGLDERAQKIRSEIESAEQARRQAKDALEQYQKSLAEARNEAQKMLEQTKASQLALAAELKNKADLELNAMKERARRDIESAKRTALNEIYTEAANLATGVASKILRREINPGDQRKLVEESLVELQGMKS